MTTTVTSVLPITNIINVSVSNLPSGVTSPNVNNLALFTNEAPPNGNTYFQYLNAAQVATDFGTNSVTAAMANAIFSQAPNILSGNGSLIVIPMLAAVSATAGYFTTTSMTANIANFAAVTNGDLKITINGVVNNIGNLNFTGVTTVAGIAAVLNNAILDALVTVSGPDIVFTSNKVGSASTIALAAYAGGGTDLTGATYLNSSGGAATGGANSSGETVSACTSRTATAVQYFGIITNVNLEDAAITAEATAVQALDNIFLHHVASAGQDPAGIVTTIASATDTKTRLVLYSQGQAAANLMKAAYAGRAFSTVFSGSATVGTMNLKPLATIVPDPGINQTIYGQCVTAGCDFYCSIAGVPSVVSTGANDYFDNQYVNAALKFDLETAGFNFLRQTNTKVPQTEQGMNGLKSAYRSVMRQYVTNGALAPGAWNSSQTFGDPVTFLNNVATTGFYIYSLPVSQQAQALRAQRQAPLVQISAKRSGAIQTSNVTVIVQA